MKLLKLISISILTITISSFSFADQHEITDRLYFGIDGGPGTLDGHCEPINLVTKIANNLTVNIDVQAQSRTTIIVLVSSTLISNVLVSNVLVPTIGLTTFNLTNTQLSIATLINNRGNCDDSTNNFTGHLGFEFNDNLAIEGFYSSNGEVEVQGDMEFVGDILIDNNIQLVLGNPFSVAFSTSINPATVNLAITDKVSLSSYGLNLKGNFAVSDNIYILGKFGVHFINESHSYSIASAATPSNLVVKAPHPNLLNLGNNANKTIPATVTTIPFENPNQFLKTTTEEKSAMGVVLGAGAKYHINNNMLINLGADILTGGDVDLTRFYAGMAIKF